MHMCAGPRPPLPPCVLGCAMLKTPLPPMLRTYYVHSPLFYQIQGVYQMKYLKDAINLIWYQFHAES